MCMVIDEKKEIKSDAVHFLSLLYDGTGTISRTRNV